MTRWLTFFSACTFFSVLAAQSPAPLQQYAVYEPAHTSVLSEGNWFKMKITSTGIYKLTYEDLAGMGFTNPSDISIFGNGGSMVPIVNSKPRYDDLIENKVYQYNGTDGVFNQGDYILFYCQGPIAWTYNETSAMFEHQVHQYSDAAWYFVTEGRGNKGRITSKPAIAGTPTIQVTSFDDYSFHEKNKYNFLESGRQWFGERIDYEKDRTYDTTFVFDNIVTSAPLKIKVNVASRSSQSRLFNISCNDSFLGSISLGPVTLTEKTGPYGNQQSAKYSTLPEGDPVNIKVAYSGSGSTDEGYLDYIVVNARRNLSFTGDVMLFRDITVAGTGSVVRYSIGNCTQQTEIWDITDPFNIYAVSAQLNGSTLSFTDSATVLKEYIVLNKGGAFQKPVIDKTVSNVGMIPNQNLHGLNAFQMLIVTNKKFKDAADSIAMLHRTNDNMTVEVISTDQIYNEFSSGAPDVSAVRDLARMIYNRASDENNRLRYLLFVGDGSYNNLSQNEGNSNYILTYQSENSINASYSYVSDDFFGLLDPTEGGTTFMESFTLDLGIGRLPVKTEKEAMAVYRKIKSYSDPKNKGDWQNVIQFAADDQDGNLHMNQADELARWLDANHPEMAVKKVYLDAYPRVSSTTGARYPDAKQAIINNIQKGSLIFNYTGHGGEMGLADEQILMREDLTVLTNSKHLPLFITATCEFSRFDDLMREEDGTLTESTSAGELSLLNENGGSIALITTTRIVYSSENHALNRQFYQIAFSKDAHGNYYRLGDVLKMAKNVLDGRNKLNFILLGDPALKLAIPANKVITDSINHIAVTDPLDTLKAFSKIHVSGHVTDQHNNLMADYNGTIYPSVYDKAKVITTLANASNTVPMQFNTREDLLYKGKITVVNGRFEFDFVVPKDITYSYGNGRIIYYSDNASTDANGEFSRVVIGGTDILAGQDQFGPEIELYMNDENFNDRGITGPNPVILARINDENGINTVGNGIGHDITGVIDGVISSPVVMNDYFQSDLNDYSSGTITYPMFNLPEGMHTLTVKVWDIYNNSSEATIVFRVVNDNTPAVSRVFNYPNPARDFTTFNFEHNQAGQELSVTISVFDLSGRLIHNQTSQIQTSGFNTSLPEWDLKDSSGNLIKPGIYPWRIRITDENGSHADSYQKLVVVR